jgi:hypothetical protein
MKTGTFLRGLLCTVLALCGTALAKPTIFWNSDANMVNLTSDGTPMDGGFKFELGVFSGSFIPTAANTAEWLTYWVPAKSTNYFPNTKRFADDLTVQSNASPFTSGKAVYIWGSRGSAISGEWILFRADSWKFPLATGFGSLEWFVKDATAVLGEINSSGSPHLMKSVAIAKSVPVPPKETWGQWRAANLAGKEKILPHEDADGDGMANILEFAFGTDGGKPGPPTHTPVSLSSDHLVITIPRRQDRNVNLTVEVSNDLINWNSGPDHTEVLEDGPLGWVVRDRVAHGAANPKRFIRIKAEIPTP